MERWRTAERSAEDVKNVTEEDYDIPSPERPFIQRDVLHFYQPKAL